MSVKPSRKEFITELQKLSQDNNGQPISRDFFRSKSKLKDKWTAKFATFNDFLQAAGLTGARRPAVKAENKPEEPREVFLRRENIRLTAEVKKQYEANGFWQEMTDHIVEAIHALTPLQPVPFKVVNTSGSEVAAVLKLSDWHIGEVISPEETEGFGEFNWALAQERVRYIIQKFLTWIQTQRTSYDIQDLYVFCEGDWVSGDIHDELLRTNEFPLPVQACNAGELLAQAISSLAPHFRKVIMVEIGPDNHGRLVRKPQFKQKATNSMSYVVYTVANAHLTKHENVEFITTPGIKHVVDVVGVKFLLEHGDTVKAWMGIPFYGLERERGREAIKRMQAMLDDQRSLEKLEREIGFDYISCGHWHVPGIVSGNILINGSLSGTSEFDHGCGRHALPTQVSFLVHPKHKLFNWVAWTAEN
jgi:hypothetical protein